MIFLRDLYSFNIQQIEFGLISSQSIGDKTSTILYYNLFSKYYLHNPEGLCYRTQVQSIFSRIWIVFCEI